MNNSLIAHALPLQHKFLCWKTGIERTPASIPRHECSKVLLVRVDITPSTGALITFSHDLSQSGCTLATFDLPAPPSSSQRLSVHNSAVRTFGASSGFSSNFHGRPAPLASDATGHATTTYGGIGIVRRQDGGGGLRMAASETRAVTLKKPMGLVLEENVSGFGGMRVKEVTEGGSAQVCPPSSKEPFLFVQLLTLLVIWLLFGTRVNPGRLLISPMFDVNRP